MTKSNQVKKLVLAALFLALGLLLPFLTGQIPSVGSMLLPMHIPVLLCGFFCSWQYGLIVGLITPILRSLIFGMPPMFPTAVCMAAELAAYGLFTAIFYHAFGKGVLATYASLLLSMLAGRIVWGAVSMLVFALAGNPFTFEIFLAGAILNAIPGIVLQFVLIPPLVFLLRRQTA